MATTSKNENEAFQGISDNSMSWSPWLNTIFLWRRNFPSENFNLSLKGFQSQSPWVILINPRWVILVGSFTQSPLSRHNLRTKMDARNLVTASERDDPIYAPMKEILKEKKPKVIGPKQPKEYICQICDKKYSCRSSLWQHKKTHTGERKYKERVFKRLNRLT